MTERDGHQGDARRERVVGIRLPKPCKHAPDEFGRAIHDRKLYVCRTYAAANSHGTPPGSGLGVEP